jgi:glycosyltransferase involved in cell wall biosynthesis
MRPQVSVVMPVYNQEKYLAETIESVLSQTFQDFEFLILDDGCTDGSALIIKQYASTDNRIIPLFQSNAGKCIVTNKLVNESNGHWCALLDADDVMLPNRLEKQVSYLKLNPELDACSCHCYYIDQKGNNLGQQCYPYLKTIEDCRQAKAKNKAILCSFTGLMVSKKAYLESGGLIGKFWPAEDVEFINRLVEKGYLLVIIQEKLMKYRVHPFSITNSNLWHSYV